MAESNRRFPKPAQASLSVLIPAYNAERWIGPTLDYLEKSLDPQKWKSVEVVIIDDGSTDKTSQAARNHPTKLPVRIIRQANQGRLAARQNGLKHTKGDYVFLLDSRVFAQADAFDYLVNIMNRDPRAVVWNGHIEIERRANPYARFWHTIAFVAWRRYWKKPRLTHYGLKDFDYYPKGAGCFLAPRTLLLDGYQKFKTFYKDPKHANDDTSLIREIASHHDIYISPAFAFYYNSRSTFKAFIKHTVHRGIVFLDGHFHPHNRYFYPLMLYFLMTPLIIVAIILLPRLLLFLPGVLMLAWVGLTSLGLPWRDGLAFIIVAPVFALFYSLGLWQGMGMRLRDKSFQTQSTS